MHGESKANTWCFWCSRMKSSQCQYVHTIDLLVLESRKSEVQLNDIPIELRQIRTLFVIDEWKKSLMGHSNGESCADPSHSKAEGFSVGFQYT